MSVHKRYSFSPPTTTTTSNDLKHRVISCLNKLSDRDTLPLATAELESIAKSLSHDTFSPFLNCIHNTDSSCKSPVRKQCVNLLTLLSHSHGNMLSSHLTKMISTVTRRLRDPDSAVRSACVEATSAMSSQITDPPFSTLWKPLFEMVTLEQDYNVQIGAAMCFAAAIESSPEPEAEQLRKVLPKLGKLVKFEGFKAKGALLSVIRSVIGVGGASTKSVIDWLVPCLVEFLSSEDWSARKAAAEALGQVSVAEKELAAEHKVACLNSLESRRFDKVKMVRETMNRTLDLWKELPDICEEASVSSLSGSSSMEPENPIGGCPPLASKSSNDVRFRRPQPKKSIPESRSPPASASLVTTAKNQIPVISDDKNSKTALSRKLDHKKISPCRIGIAVSRDKACGDDFTKQEFGEDGNNGNSMPETKRVLFSTSPNDKHQKFSGFRSGSRVVPYDDDEYTCSKDIEVSNPIDDFHESSRDMENISLIRKQLIQIESQQSDLLSVLQRFMGHSQNGIDSLEKRIRGLEMALDEISYDLAISNGRIPNPDSTYNSCCKLPGAVFLSSKLWRRAEDRYATSRPSSFCSIQRPQEAKSIPARDTDTSTYIPASQKFQHNNSIRRLVNSCTDDSCAAKGNSSLCSSQMSEYINRASVQGHSAIVLTEASLATSTAPMNICNWLKGFTLAIG
ncbi:hypothetical protein K2173_006351 [Erythroxylum novogranatense]|uniref:TORTIFOLIA1/SINE1-2 N-terminal domain-containing protein n=1 Tax=Erythroxylum novogranatense TaxID=1862640 RepID=A0AAV8U4E1_9ROSI|nr:hypothetical protein K2173_006351 [Erythroxylum novogranatense]